MKTNVGRARAILQSLARQGVSEIVICAGARNAPFVALLDQVDGLKVHAFFEERSAGFFALGRVRATGRPVAVCTTSGTAVAELLPAVIEADYQRLPLIVLSADRPVAYRGTGAPQTIVQPGIFSNYVETTWDLSEAVLEMTLPLQRPSHINVCFEEPLVDEAIERWQLSPAAIVSSATPAPSVAISALRPLVLVSGLSSEEATEILPIIKSWNRPVYAEATSQLRGHPELTALELQGSEPFSHLDFDGVIRIGNVPTLRFWRDLEASPHSVWHFSKFPWSGLPREKCVWPLASLKAVTANFAKWEENERAIDRERAASLKHLLAEFPLSEPAWIQRLSQWIPEKALVFLGNSLPIREWDLCAVGGRAHKVEGNRGVNGIDGLTSTFLGLADAQRSNWAVVGDLSALYDLTGLWAARSREIRDLNIVVINNGGGKIFERMFKTALFENRHDLEFSGWAKMWNWDYLKCTEAVSAVAENSRPRIIEIVPDAAHTKGFFDSWEKLR